MAKVEKILEWSIQVVFAFLFKSICASGVKEKMGLIWTKERQTEGFSVEAAVNWFMLVIAVGGVSL